MFFTTGLSISSAFRACVPALHDLSPLCRASTNVASYPLGHRASTQLAHSHLHLVPYHNALTLPLPHFRLDMRPRLRQRDRSARDAALSTATRRAMHSTRGAVGWVERTGSWWAKKGSRVELCRAYYIWTLFRLALALASWTSSRSILECSTCIPVLSSAFASRMLLYVPVLPCSTSWTVCTVNISILRFSLWCERMQCESCLFVSSVVSGLRKDLMPDAFL